MPDPVNAKKNEGEFRPHPSGQFAATCVDTINFGKRVETFPGKAERVVEKCGLVFRTGKTNPETGEVIDLVREFTVSMFELAALRQFLESWRGQSYTEDEADAGVPLHKLVGVSALISVEHKKSAKGRTYANIKSIAPLPKEMRPSAPAIAGYKRPPYLDDRKQEYADGLKKYLASINHAEDADEDGAPRRVRVEESAGVGLPADDGLPF